MGRYRFTPDDLAPLAPFLNLPFARQVFEAAVPVKKFSKRPIDEELPLSVTIKDRNNPNGIPLELLLEEAQKISPTATGISLRRGKLVVTHQRPPAAAESGKLAALFRDKARLDGLGRRSDGARSGARAEADAGHAPAAAAAPDPALVKLLRDPNTSNERWVAAFREYAVKHLIKE